VEPGKHGDPVDHVPFTFVAEDRFKDVPNLRETERSEHVVSEDAEQILTSPFAVS
jgi:hypothetical protein